MFGARAPPCSAALGSASHVALASPHQPRAPLWRAPPRADAPLPRGADLVNVFEVFLPQLLLYPNPTDPLNGEAAALLMREPEAYARRVREHTGRFAAPGAAAAAAGGGDGAGGSGAAGGGGDSSSSDDGADDYMSSEDDAADVEV
jgi:hypothetical protein